jgi:hypothetical protein
MVYLRLTKMQVQEILLWAQHYRDMLKEVGMGFDRDEIDLHLKIFLSLSKETGHTEEEFYSRYPDRQGWFERQAKSLSSAVVNGGVSERPSGTEVSKHEIEV